MGGMFLEPGHRYAPVKVGGVAKAYPKRLAPPPRWHWWYGIEWVVLRRIAVYAAMVWGAGLAAVLALAWAQGAIV